MKKPKIVVLGGGYGGLMTVSVLQKQLKKEEAEIILVSNEDYQYLTTKLHEPPAGTLEETKIQIMIKEVIDMNVVTFIKSKVIAINKDTKTVLLEMEKIPFDYLVVAFGAVPETFDIPGVREYANFIYNFKSIYQLKRQIEHVFKKYCAQPNDTLLNFIVVGGGFTGIEFLAELAYNAPTLSKKYDIPLDKIKIICIEASSSILNEFDQEIIHYSMSILEQFGITIVLNKSVKKVEKDGVILKDSDEKIYGSTIIWTVGIRGQHIATQAGFQGDKGRVKINEFLQVPDTSNIFFIGDSSIFTDEYGIEQPPTAQIAIQQGEYCAKFIINLIKGIQNPKPFKYIHRGTLMSLGRKKASGVVFGKRVKGRIAAVLKKVTEWRYYLKLGGIKLFLKKMFI